MAPDYDFGSVPFLRPEGNVVVTDGHLGIGRACCCALARVGCDIVIVYRDSEGARDSARKFADEIEGQFSKIHVRTYGCQDVEKVYDLLKKIRAETATITGLIVTQDASVIKPAMDLTHEEFQNVFNINVYAPFNISRAAARLWMEENTQGSIVIVASMSAQIINQIAPNKPLTQAFYSASKAAVRNLAPALAAEWAEKNIRVNTISPGYVETEETKHMDKEILKHQLDNVPLRRLGQPRDIAGQALLLLSRGGAYMTGSDFVVDGGQTIW